MFGGPNRHGIHGLLFAMDRLSRRASGGVPRVPRVAASGRLSASEAAFLHPREHYPPGPRAESCGAACSGAGGSRSGWRSSVGGETAATSQRRPLKGREPRHRYAHHSTGEPPRTRPAGKLADVCARPIELRAGREGSPELVAPPPGAQLGARSDVRRSGGAGSRSLGLGSRGGAPVFSQRRVSSAHLLDRYILRGSASIR